MQDFLTGAESSFREGIKRADIYFFYEKIKARMYGPIRFFH